MDHHDQLFRTAQSLPSANSLPTIRTKFHVASTSELSPEFAGANHAVVICSRLTLSGLPNDMKTWPSHVLVLDTQFGISCAASDYHTHFNEAMTDHDGAGLETFHEEIQDWVKPVDPRWKAGILDTPHWGDD